MSRDIEIIHCEIRQAYTSPYGWVKKTLVPEDGWEMVLRKGQFLEVRRPGWAGAALVPYENIRGMSRAPDRAGVDHKGRTVNEAGRVIKDSQGRPVAPPEEDTRAADSLADALEK